MLDRTEIARRLKEHETQLARFHVRSLALFGSTLRGTAGPQSDIDLLVDFERPVDLVTFIELEERLSDILDAEVDLVPRDGLKPRLREGILGEAVIVL